MSIMSGIGSIEYLKCDDIRSFFLKDKHMEKELQTLTWRRTSIPFENNVSVELKRNITK